MHIKITWDQEFYDLMMYLIAKYGRDFLTLDGIGDQMDINKFSKDFFNTDTTTADVSVDSNANVCARTSIEYNHEMPKPIKKYNSYFLLWKQIKKDYGLLEANTIVEKVLRGDLYVNDSTDVALPYCFNYSTYDIALNGLEGVSKRVRVSAPKSLETFVRQVEQFMVVAANSTLGATGFADFLIVASLFVEKMKKIGYDGRIKVDDYKTYVKEKLINFIYTVNWEFRGNQSPFSNLSVFDRNFLESLCPDYMMDGKAANPETVHELQGLFLDAMNEEMRRTPLTFPVTTACFSIDDDRNIVDKDFVKFIAEKNKEFGFINMYNGKMSTLSSCCFSGGQKVLTKSSNGVVLADIRDIVKSSNYDLYRKNFAVFHNGSWVKAKPVMLPVLGHKMYKVVLSNKKEFVVTDNHINYTLSGDKTTVDLTTDDYIGFSMRELNSYNEKDEHLTYAQGYLIGAYAGDGSRYAREGVESYDVTFSLSEAKRGCIDTLIQAAKDWGIEEDFHINPSRNKVVFAKIYSKAIYDIIGKYVKGSYAEEKSFDMNILLQSTEFRKGIIAGWYATDGGNSNRIYSTSKELIETGEAILTSLGMVSNIDLSDRTDELVEIRGKNYSRNYPLYCIRWYDLKNRREHPGVYKVRNNSVYFKVESVEEVPYDEEYVYCFEMQNPEEPYFTLPNGVITHNCRLRSDRKNEYFNSFGSGSTKIGSLGVVTANFPRLAMQSGGDEGVFIDKLRDAFFTAAKINNAKRKIVQRRIDLGAAPLYTHGYMDITKQYSTFGVTGLYEAVSILGKDILNEDGQDLVMRTLEQINLWIDEAQELYQSPHNCEQVPAESSSVKLAKKDKVLGYDCGVSFYSNQFIPLIAKANMLDRIRLQGKFDGLFSGGAICHVNVGERIEDTKNIEDLIFYAAKSGVVYWAINYLLRICDDNHTWVGSDRCPVCGREWSEEITRVVGFFTNVKNWNKVRREKDRPNRQFYGKEEMRCE